MTKTFHERLLEDVSHAAEAQEHGRNIVALAYAIDVLRPMVNELARLSGQVEELKRKVEALEDRR